MRITVSIRFSVAFRPTLQLSKKTNARKAEPLSFGEVWSKFWMGLETMMRAACRDECQGDSYQSFLPMQLTWMELPGLSLACTERH